jgi:hypothetical protein
MLRNFSYNTNSNKEEGKNNNKTSQISIKVNSLVGDDNLSSLLDKNKNYKMK